MERLRLSLLLVAGCCSLGAATATRDALAGIENEMRNAIFHGGKRYEQHNGTSSDDPAP